MNSFKLFAKNTLKDKYPLTNREIVDKNQQVETFMTKEKLRNAVFLCLAVGVFIGFLSPFGMNEIPIHWSLLYWVITCISGYFVYMPILFFGNSLLVNTLPIHWMRVAITTFISSILMSFLIPVLTWIILSIEIDLSTQFFEIFPKAIVIGGVITFVTLIQDYIKEQKSELVSQKKLNEEQQEQANNNTDKNIEEFMALLPIDKRGELICLEMADHYIKVYTDKGHHLLLMRFKDALGKLAQYPGLQTHRSWWVAKSAITSMKKEGRKTFLLVGNDLEVPISRTHAESVKDANIH